MQKASLFVNCPKSEFGKKRIQFLGFQIEQGTFNVQDDKVRDVQHWPQLDTIRDVRSFLGLTGFYHVFIKDYARITAPLIY